MATDPSIGTSIRRARERRRWTQRRLADELGVNVKTVDNWEHNRTSPRSSIGALEDVLDISFDGTPEPEPELIPMNDWERATLLNPDLPEDVKRAFILDWRRERAAYKESQQREGRGTLPTAGRHAAG